MSPFIPHLRLYKNNTQSLIRQYEKTQKTQQQKNKKSGTFGETRLFFSPSTCYPEVLNEVRERETLQLKKETEKSAVMLLDGSEQIRKCTFEPGTRSRLRASHLAAQGSAHKRTVIISQRLILRQLLTPLDTQKRSALYFKFPVFQDIILLIRLKFKI